MILNRSYDEPFLSSQHLQIQWKIPLNVNNDIFRLGNDVKDSQILTNESSQLSFKRVSRSNDFNTNVVRNGISFKK